MRKLTRVWYARRFLIGWLTGAGVLFGVTDWIRFVVSVHGGLGVAGGWAVFLLFCVAKGFYFGVFALFGGAGFGFLSAEHQIWRLIPIGS